jgi:hypothetical protein
VIISLRLVNFIICLRPVIISRRPVSSLSRGVSLRPVKVCLNFSLTSEYVSQTCRSREEVSPICQDSIQNFFISSVSLLSLHLRLSILSLCLQLHLTVCPVVHVCLNVLLRSLLCVPRCPSSPSASPCLPPPLLLRSRPLPSPQQTARHTRRSASLGATAAGSDLGCPPSSASPSACCLCVSPKKASKKSRKRSPSESSSSEEDDPQVLLAVLGGAEAVLRLAAGFVGPLRGAVRRARLACGLCEAFAVSHLRGDRCGLCPACARAGIQIRRWVNQYGNKREKGKGRSGLLAGLPESVCMCHSLAASGFREAFTRRDVARFG